MTPSTPMSTPTSSPTEPALSVDGRLGTIRLRRPASINAITPGDITAITTLLRRAVADPAVETILISGEGDRGFCAGGDIKRVRERIAGHELDVLADFWASEYRLDHLLATCPKPVVSIAHGLTLGGGMGLASHGSHRIVTDDSRLGMPEVLIGLSPDIGGLWLFANAPGSTGAYAALTAAHLSAGDAIYMNLADHYVPQPAIGEVVERLKHAAPSEVLGGFSDRPPSWVGAHRTAIDAVFGMDSLRDIRNVLTAAADRTTAPAELGEVAHRAASTFAEASPTALAVTHEALKRAAAMPDLAECLRQDLVVTLRCARYPDLAEGIRARVVDKDRNPAWKPPTLDEVTASQVAAFFEPVDPPLQLTGW
ncbi:enoyl-CoA hydratase/isomerase family protein [Mycobacterium sp. NPDC003449]